MSNEYYAQLMRHAVNFIRAENDDDDLFFHHEGTRRSLKYELAKAAEALSHAAGQEGATFPVAWRSKDFNPIFADGFAWAYTSNAAEVGPYHEPLYARPHEAMQLLRSVVDQVNSPDYSGGISEALHYKILGVLRQLEPDVMYHCAGCNHIWYAPMHPYHMCPSCNPQDTGEE